MPQLINLLVVDDCPEDVMLLQRAFLKAGRNVALQSVRDGQEAMDYLTGVGKYSDRQTFPIPRMVLLDLKMPRVDGFELLHWLRKESALNNLPVIVFSSSNQQKDVDRAYSLFVNSYLCKPTDFRGYMTVAETIFQYWMSLNFPPSCAL